MFEIHFTIKDIPKTKQIENINIWYSFIKAIEESEQSFMSVVDYGKIWLLDLDDIDNPLYVFKFDTSIRKYILIDLRNNKYSEYLINEYSDISIEYGKFICAAWGTLLYLDINNLSDYSTNDIDNFLVKFSSDEIHDITNNMLGNTNVDPEEDIEWVQEGMGINGQKYLTKNVVDFLFGNIMYEIEEPLVIYRTIGYAATDHSDNDYCGWVSATKGTPYDSKETTEKYILPIGFPIINTKINGNNYADNNEIIVRNEDLKKL